jgi:signal transduction histidine kinase
MNIKFNLAGKPNGQAAAETGLNFLTNKDLKEVELILITQELKKTTRYLDEYKEAVRKIMYMTSHKVRQPLANILGLSSLLDDKSSPFEIKRIIAYIKKSVVTLEAYTRELTGYINGLTKKDKE